MFFSTAIFFEMIDLTPYLRALAVRRPVFHSKPDLQHELVTHARSRDPEIEVRAGAPAMLPHKAFLDVILKAGAFEFALEIMYCTRSLKTSIDGESFDLVDQVAQGARFQTFLQGVERLKAFANSSSSRAGAALMVTNDPVFWSPHTMVRDSLQSAHLIHPPAILRDQLRANWRGYSKIPGQTFGTFNCLLVPIGWQ
ncbi:hypothetical protein AYJ57_21765 (plasmid) [Salipiger sp. CCB-MM3]|uniref:hypothetical protein n=1 Tax=Salipiger sp. CCB-MM3 TaxID=1792508 RepID=UPI00080AB43F|nr:hypothetical protein [Salipiger sp. CCB-MM3]ANT63100.1 hypothetical protein AYJ57_21765 [Salipiger sp. CCB-MM3]